ncbi:stabilizer of axonemal microtubules 1-like [Centropristis striata]|uniref:stabilizer of axonemal microtubules 1-like n=1 Tax=Centropristis striata TaxID=184440 RepID=UPI0027E07DD9|nr:stabilizer of axonemal microtubules 1-like [Centropristis striata]
MHPKTMRQQNGTQPATSMRKQSGFQTRASMTTEYQQRFLPPHCSKAVVTSLTQKDPYHSLKGTSADMATFRSFYVTHKWIKHPPKAQQPFVPPQNHRRCSSDQHNPERFVASQVDYTSVYKNDFQAWKANKRQPFKLSDSLKVNQGLVVPNRIYKEGRSQKNSVQVPANSKPVPQEEGPHPIESVTSYRSDYITHPVQPRTLTKKPAYQTKGLTLQAAVSLKPKAAWDIHQEPLDEASQLFQEFKAWSLDNKFLGQSKAKESGPAADHDDFLSTTHADYTAHKCQRTKPILPSMQTREREKGEEPFSKTTTMREDYKGWHTPQRLPIVPKDEMDWPKKPTFSLGTPHKAVCNSTCNAMKTPQCPAQNGESSGLECVCPGTEEYRMYWTSSRDRGVTWADGGTCEEPSQGHEIISCVVSSRS